MQNIFNIESVNFSKSEEPGRVNDAPTRGTLSCTTYYGNRWFDRPTPPRISFPFRQFYRFFIFGSFYRQTKAQGN